MLITPYQKIMYLSMLLQGVDDCGGGGGDGDDDGNYNAAAEEAGRINAKKHHKIHRFTCVFEQQSGYTLSSMLEDGDKRSLDEYLTCKCLIKFRSKQEVDLLHERRVGQDDEMRHLINERTRNHIAFNRCTDISPMDTDGYRNKIFDDIRLTEVEQKWKIRAKELVKKKGVFPFCWFNDIEKTERSHPPSQSYFCDDLSNQYISDEKYQHMLDVWSHFDFNNLGEYMEVYKEVGVAVLQCAVEKFRAEAARNYSNLDPIR